jgi:Tfp pilus assembly protein PilE
MTTEEQILAALDRLIQLQEQSFALQKQVFENQQQAVAQQRQAIQHQRAIGRLYQIAVAAAALLVGFLLFKILPYLH